MKNFLTIIAGTILAVGFSGLVFAADQGMMGNKAMQEGMAMAPMSAHGQFANYTQTDFEAAKGMKRVLFFAATWCPTCMGTVKNLMEQPTGIPPGVEVFRVDFDSSTDLKAQYGVTQMDTFVLVDAEGKKVALWNGGGVEGLAKNIK
ncbi:MAG: thioredoxin family protein [Candidatus Omnitrophica bacterium]|nr:thioredoxin family protein [Candidatus Omnitrophota bacterium]